MQGSLKAARAFNLPPKYLPPLKLEHLIPQRLSTILRFQLTEPGTFGRTRPGGRVVFAVLCVTELRLSKLPLFNSPVSCSTHTHAHTLTDKEVMSNSNAILYWLGRSVCLCCYGYLKDSLTQRRKFFMKRILALRNIPE